MCGIKYHAIGRTLVAVIGRRCFFFREDYTLRGYTPRLRCSITSNPKAGPATHVLQVQ